MNNKDKLVLKTYQLYNMAKSKSTNSNKITFGKRKCGSYKKTHNKHTPRPKGYVGQGR